MKPHNKAVGAGLVLAALLTLGFPAFAADPAPAPDSAPTPAPARQDRAADDMGIAVDPADGSHPSHHHGKGDDRVAIMGSVSVGPDEEVNGSAVAVMGSVAVNGTVDEDAVAVLGSNTINGTVHGSAVSVLGNLRLGPNARVDGDVVCIGGRYTRAPSAFVGGKEIEKQAGANFSHNEQLHAWLDHGLRLGRPFALRGHHPGFWFLGLAVFVLCILLALLFPGAVGKCGDTLAQRPGATFLTGILAVLALPVLFLVLMITLVGIPVALGVLPLSLFTCVLFGKTAIYALAGRSIIGRQNPAAAGVLVGGVLFSVLYFVPFLGGAVWLMVGFLGFACVLTTLFSSARKPAPAGIAPAPAAVPAVAAGAAAPATEPPAVFETPAPVAPALSAVAESGLPRAGFWIRMAALLVDAILVGVVTHMCSFFLPILAIYGAILWKLKGSTIGGIIFGLKVVRVDGKPAEWVTMIVRALACFFSLIVVGLGFFWIAFDPERQAWHDKIAGTVVVRLPKGVSLV